MEKRNNNENDPAKNKREDNNDMHSERAFKSEVGAITFDICDVFQSPIVFHGPEWAGDAPLEVRQAVPTARMLNLMQGIKKATWEEACLYLYSRSLAGPLDHQWGRIYSHVGTRVAEKVFGKNHWDHPSVAKTLTDEEQQALDGLLIDIYEKRRALLKRHFEVVAKPTPPGPKKRPR